MILSELDVEDLQCNKGQNERVQKDECLYSVIHNLYIYETSSHFAGSSSISPNSHVYCFVQRFHRKWVSEIKGPDLPGAKNEKFWSANYQLVSA